MASGSVDLPAVGDTWADNDYRAVGRRIRIEAISGGYADCVVTAENARENAHRRWAAPRPPGWTSVGTRTRIRLDRFRLTSTGYRFVSHGP